jgi:hypothetical protein
MKASFVSISTTGETWLLEDDQTIQYTLPARSMGAGWHHPTRPTDHAKVISSAVETWLVNREGLIYKYDPGLGWIRPGKENDRAQWIATGAAWGAWPPPPETWCVDPDGKMYRWDYGGTNYWQPVGKDTDRATMISVGGKYEAVCVSPNNEIFEWVGGPTGGWQRKGKDTDRARFVSLGSQGECWCISPEGKIFRWNSSTNAWYMPGKESDRAAAIDVAEVGLILCVNEAGELFQWEFDNMLPAPDEKGQWKKIDLSKGEVPNL